jgi:hypothetical protein
MTEATSDQVFPDICRKGLPLDIAFKAQTKISEELFPQVSYQLGGIACLRADSQLAL